MELWDEVEYGDLLPLPVLMSKLKHGVYNITAESYEFIRNYGCDKIGTVLI